MGRRRKAKAKLVTNHSPWLVAQRLEEEHQDDNSILEASGHTSNRRRIVVATFTGPAGGQVGRSTGLTDDHQARQLARRWEAQATAHRAKSGQTPSQSRTRPGPAGLTQKEVARIMGMSERGIRALERRALQKLRKHPLVRRLWGQSMAGELDEDCWLLSPMEMMALFDVAETPEALRRVEKLLAMIRC